jgi:putative alpha-1,2-mannosidase
VFSALGFYPLAGTDVYLVGAPLFSRATLRLPGGVLTIRASPDPGRNPYVRSITINGRSLSRPWFLHPEIARGGEMEFVMSDRPWPRGEMESNP